MVCHLFHTKLLPEPNDDLSDTFESKFETYHKEKEF